MVNNSGRMMADRDDNIWKTSSEGSLIKFSVQYRRFQTFSFQHLIPTTPRSAALTEGINRHIWVGTAQGLIRGIPQGDSLHFIHYKNEPSNPQSLNNNFVLSLLDDPENPQTFLWIGTKGGGLNLLNKESGTVRHFTKKDGLPNDVVYGVLSDKNGNLWLSTNRGLSKFNPKRRTFENYTAGDGLQDNEFNTMSYAKGHDGRLIFGGINGLTSFYPEDLEASDFPPPVFVTALKINNKLITHKDSSNILKCPIEQTKSVILKHDENLLTFEFAALDFTNPEKNQFKYFLEGVNRDWVISGNENTATFANMTPGEYTFYVKGTNSSGTWNEKPAVLKITILPPWWHTKLAYGIYFLLFMGTLYAIYRFQINRVKLQNELAYEQKEAERLTELDRIKTNFFSNITHEFRTPLTLIIEPLRQLISKPKDSDWLPKIKLAERNSQKLLELVNQLLDLAKLEGKKMNLDLRRGDMLETIRPIYQSFLPLAEKKNIRLQFMADKDLETFYFDKKKAEKIVYNLLSNAIKFTENGNVKLEIISNRDVPNFENLEYLTLTVSDTGSGISERDLPKIFDRFYQVDGSATRENEGTGIGLALTKELTELMGGKIEVESEVGKGTEFRILLPMPALPPDPLKGGSPPTALIHDIGDNIHQSYDSFPAEAGESSPFRGAGGSAGKDSSLITHHSSLNLILLIEDNPEMRQFIKHSLPEEYQIVEASNGDEGIKKAGELIPDLVISDLMMPKKNGFEVTDFLKNDEKTSHIPIILLTAKSAVESKIKGLKRGADAYLTKPFHTEELIVRIEKLIETRRLLQAKFS